MWPFGRRSKADRWSPRGRWSAAIEQVHEGTAEIGEITFEDGSRWQGMWVTIDKDETPEQAVERTIQSLIDQGEFELVLSRLDQRDAVAEVVSWFGRRKLRLVVQRDDLHGDWAAKVTRPHDGRVLQARYGNGPTAEAAALSAQKRYEQEQ